jgi:hypothetical protein
MLVRAASATAMTRDQGMRSTETSACSSMSRKAAGCGGMRTFVTRHRPEITFQAHEMAAVCDFLPLRFRTVGRDRARRMLTAPGELHPESGRRARPHAAWAA